MNTYLCGCDVVAKQTYLQTTQSDGSQNHVRKDKQGFQVCPEHGERKTGWRLRALQKARKRDASLNVNWSGPDTRDLRDQELLGKQQLAKGNGHGKHN